MSESEPAPISLDNAGLAFGLVAAAGASTALGAAAVFERRVVKMASKRILAAGLGFSSGVMLYVSFIEIFAKSRSAFEYDMDEDEAYFSATACLFGGMLLLKLIDVVVHAIDRGHHATGSAGCIDDAQEISVHIPPLMRTLNDEAIPQWDVPDAHGADSSAGTSAPPAAAARRSAGNMQDLAARAAVQAAIDDAEAAKAAAAAQKELQKMGLNTALAIGIHNFPEGLATFVATLADPSVGATLAIAIGVHNIPEGLCVALPIYYATNSRLKGFLWACLSGVSEPIGALIGYGILKASGSDLNQLVYGVLFGIVAGLMVMIVIMELLPTAYGYDPKDKYTTNSVVVGMATMALSLCLFRV